MDSKEFRSHDALGDDRMKKLVLAVEGKLMEPEDADKQVETAGKKDKVATSKDDIIDVDATVSRKNKDTPAIASEDDIIDVDATTRSTASAFKCNNEIINVEDIEANVVTIFDYNHRLLSNVYAFEGPGNEFEKRVTDSRGWKKALGKTFTGVEQNGCGEIDLFHLQNWFCDLCFNSIVTDKADSQGCQWHFRLVMINPRASNIDQPMNAQNKNNVATFIPLLTTFHKHLFSETRETEQTVALAVDNDISFMVVLVRCKDGNVVDPFWKKGKQAKKIVAAITFRHSSPPDNETNVDVHVSWLSVVANAMKPIPYNNRNKGWRHQGFGLFMLKCMIKSVYARLPSIQALDVYLQCYEPQSYNCYAKLGFVQINTAFVDGFDQRKSKDCLLILFCQRRRKQDHHLFQRCTTIHQR
jgi:hypothetical protein